MINWIDLLNFTFAVAGVIVALMGLFLSVSSTQLDRRSRIFFVTVFTLVIAYVLSDLIGQISLTMLGQGYATLARIAIFCESLFSSMLMPVLTVYLLQCAGENWRKSTVFTAALVLWLAYFFLLVCTLKVKLPDIS